MLTKIYILQDERIKEQTGEIIIHKFVISTFKKVKVGDSVPVKLFIDELEGDKKIKQFVNVEITAKKGKRYYEGVIR